MVATNFARLFQRYSRKPFKLFQIEPTLQCGLKCVMCPWTALRQSAGSMDWETFQHIAAYLPLAREVDFTGGGEPLLHPRLLEMIWTAKQAHCRVGFSTNGLQLTAEMSKELLTLNLDWISFSVDAARPEIYEKIRPGAQFQRVCDHIAALDALRSSRSGRFFQKRRPDMMMVLVMMRGETENVDQLGEYVELAHRLGVDQVILKNLDVITKESDDQRRVFSHRKTSAPELEAELAKARNLADRLGVRLRLYALQPVEQAICEHNPIHSLFINWEGYLSPCITLSYAEERIFGGQKLRVDCCRFGNIRTEPLDAILNRAEYAAFRQSFQGRQQADRQVAMETYLHGMDQASVSLPPAPEPCRSCYYLYGV